MSTARGMTAMALLTAVGTGLVLAFVGSPFGSGNGGVGGGGSGQAGPPLCFSEDCLLYGAADSGVAQVFGGPLAVDAGVLAQTIGMDPQEALGTCNAAREFQLKADSSSGGTTGFASRVCVCASDGAATPAYAWVDLASGLTGTATTCFP